MAATWSSRGPTTRTPGRARPHRAPHSSDLVPQGGLPACPAGPHDPTQGTAPQDPPGSTAFLSVPKARSPPAQLGGLGDPPPEQALPSGTQVTGTPQGAQVQEGGAGSHRLVLTVS